MRIATLLLAPALLAAPFLAARLLAAALLAAALLAAAPCGLFTLFGVAMLLSPSEARGDLDRETGRFGGDVSAASFSEYCEGELPSDRKSKFFAALDAADSALAARNTNDARNSLSEAFGAAYRGGADSEISIKCLGESVARRWFEAQLELRRQQSAIDSRRSRDEAALLYVTAADQDATALVSRVEAKRARRFISSLRVLEGIVARVDNDRAYGAFILSEEDALAKACREALASLQRIAEQRHRKALRDEDESFRRAITDQELTTSQAVEAAQDLAKAVLGVDAGAIGDKDALILQKRASESQEYLRSARGWNLELFEDRQTMPSSKRAHRRGDEMLARAKDPNSSLGLKDAAYREARRYYDFGGFKQASSSAAAAHQAIEPALQAARDRQEKALEEAEARFSVDAESVRRAAEDMQKSASEKERFKNEADALEDELGF
jgi:hypothetical protein